tara:strand:+ start:62 stop:598 length:537 start_codon:yes stop_codon:yes gene_type:complete
MSNFIIDPYKIIPTPATYTLLWENTAEPSYDDNQNEIYYANEFDTNDDVIGEAITKITVRLRKVGSPSETVRGTLWLSATNLGQNPSILSNETYGAGDIGTSFTTLTFTFTNTTVTAQGYKAGFTFSSAGSGSNHYNIARILEAVDGTYMAKAKAPTDSAWTYEGKEICLTNGVYKSP